MSRRNDKLLSLSGISPTIPINELKLMFQSILSKGIHGICFSPYEEGQQPGERITDEQIRRRLSIIKPFTNWIRIFSTTEGNERIPQIAKELGFQTLVGAWISNDKEKNHEEYESLINLAKEGFVDIAAVGNEVLYRKEMDEKELIETINYVKSHITNIPVGYVDAYYEFVERPLLTNTCDLILANCYPYWEGCPIEHAYIYCKEMYQQVLKIAGNKKVIVSETGWPNLGTNFESSFPSYENALSYFINIQNWANSNSIELFYFSSFDESWKTNDEGDVGAFWGLWDKQEQLKY